MFIDILELKRKYDENGALLKWNANSFLVEKAKYAPRRFGNDTPKAVLHYWHVQRYS